MKFLQLPRGSLCVQASQDQKPRRSLQSANEASHQLGCGVFRWLRDLAYSVKVSVAQFAQAGECAQPAVCFDTLSDASSIEACRCVPAVRRSLLAPAHTGSSQFAHIAFPYTSHCVPRLCVLVVVMSEHTLVTACARALGSQCIATTVVTFRNGL